MNTARRRSIRCFKSLFSGLLSSEMNLLQEERRRVLLQYRMDSERMSHDGLMARL